MNHPPRTPGLLSAVDVVTDTRAQDVSSLAGDLTSYAKPFPERIDVSVVRTLLHETVEIVGRKFLTIAPYRDDSNKLGPHGSCSIHIEGLGFRIFKGYRVNVGIRW